jgi:transglutaminase-like putative cysteine protease
VELAHRIAWMPSAHLRAAAVMRWLAEHTHYDGTHAVPGADLKRSLHAFLFEERRGICVEFATAAAVLLRLVDVPARVVTGYRTHERDDDLFVVRARHAHAWVEVAFDGAGWVPYDPTPGPEVGAAPSAPVAPAPVRGESALQGAAQGLVALGWPVWALNLVLGLLLVAGAGLYAVSRGQLRHAVRAAQLARDAPRASPELLGERERFFALLAARGFDLEGAQTPREWLAAHEAVLPAEPGLAEAIERYTALRFSGRAPAEQVVAFRRTLRSLPRRPAADRRNQRA